MFTLSSGAQVDDDDEAEIDEDPEAKNQLDKKANVMLPTFYIPKPDSNQCPVHTQRALNKLYDIRVYTIQGVPK